MREIRTFFEKSADLTSKVILEKMDFPEPVISVAVEAKSKGDQDKMGQALYRLAQEDPSFKFECVRARATRALSEAATARGPSSSRYYGEPYALDTITMTARPHAGTMRRTRRWSSRAWASCTLRSSSIG